MTRTRTATTVPTLVLLVVTAVWGSTFFMIKGILGDISALDFLGIRFLVAGLVVAVALRRRLMRANRATWLRGAILGILYSSGQVAQTVGLAHTHASVSGFITGMCVVITPVLAVVLFRERVQPQVWVAVGVSTVGLMVLSLQGWAFGAGEALTLLGAVLYALHIVVLGRWAGRDNPLTLSGIQLVVIGALCSVAALPGGVSLPRGPAQWGVVLYTALFAGLAALVAQTWAQSRMPATSAAVIFTLEPVFAAFFAIALGGESATARLLVGGGLVLAAMFVVVLAPTRAADPAPVAGAAPTQA